MHGALLRDSFAAKILFWSYGLLMLTPPDHWRYTHNFHHANVGKPVSGKSRATHSLTSDIGSFPLMTTDMWRRAPLWRRFGYRVSRHPVTILFAGVTIFLINLCMIPFIQHPLRNWQGLLAPVLQSALIVTLWMWLGFYSTFFVFLLPYMVASALGAYLFFAQHNFEGMRIVPREEWTHYRGALESSSYLTLSPMMHWFTGNIGFHHIHHLNALIPFYRLPETMKSIPELQRPLVTSLTLRDVPACLRLNLWDPVGQKLVTFRGR